MSSAHQFGAALLALGNDLGGFAQYEGSKEEQQRQEAIQQRREAAQMAFQKALYDAKAAQDQQQFDATREDRASERADMMDYRNRDLDEQTAYHQASLDQQAAEHADMSAYRKGELGIAQQNADSERLRSSREVTSHTTDRTAGVLSNRLSATGRLIQSYEKQKQGEIAALDKDPMLMADDKAKAAAAQRIAAKYQPLIDKRQSEYDALNQKFAKVTGVEFGDPEEAATQAEMGNAGTPGSSGAPAAAGAPGPTAQVPAAQAPATEPSDPYTAPQTPDPNEPPVPGAHKAPDGNWYVPDPKRPGKWLRVET